MIVCLCHRISERDIHAAVSVGASCFQSLQDGTGVASRCGRCRECAQEVLDVALASQSCADSACVLSLPLRAHPPVVLQAA